MRGMPVAAAALALVTWPLGAADRQVGAQSSTVAVYEGARVITGDGSTLIEDGAFVVRNGTIEQIGPRAGVNVPAGARHVDLRGKTVMPMIMNVHGHIGSMKGATTNKENYSRENVLDHLQRYAYYGVGAMQSLGTDRDASSFAFATSSKQAR